MSQFDIDADDSLPVSPNFAGFQRWIRTPLDDAPPIKPPKRHMLSHVTGGLTELYSVIKKDDEKKKAENAKFKELEELKLQEEERKKEAEEKAKALQKLNEIERNREVDDEEETSPYTDEDGEFCPDNSIPLLASRYKFVEVLAKGQSALIVKALDTFSREKPVAIKVLHRVYKPIGSQEADILLELHKADPWLHVPFARLLNQFIYGPHYCLVFDFMSPTPLYTHYDQKQIKGPKSLVHVRYLCVKLLTVMGFLHKQNVIHADLKPENILLVDESDMASVMVIDFGNALRNTEEELSLYYSDFELQTLLYRAPEVIFGLKFSLEIDMWSLGCLLAECYTGQPLFMGKTKEDILSKITKLLGPFPKEFGKGVCGEEFSEFIGEALTKHQRLENLRKRLTNCQDISFLLLLERLLTYLPENRISPFEAACHSFIASINPFLYLTSNEEIKRYPTVVLDVSTYPYTPDFKNDENEDPNSIKSRHRLAAYSQPPPSSITGLDRKPEVRSSTPILPEEVHKSRMSPTPEKTSVVEEPKPSITPTSQVSEPMESPARSVESSVTPLMSPSDSMSYTDSMSHASPPQSPEPKSGHVQYVVERKSNVPATKDDLIAQAKLRERMQDSNFSRTDVKQTLKSMGLKCEDFTISVYSKEQAHAILRKQGVEVTNHGQPPAPRSTPKGATRQGKPSNVRPSVSVVRTDATAKTIVKKKVEVDDDDDCIILDPPEGTKVPPPPAPPVRRFPHQFQLMGTTVQVNRGAKRPMRGMSRYAPITKRQHRNQPFSYNDRFGSYDEPQETSVQDTLKRLKNYNISITCRRNSNQRKESDDELDHRDQMMDSDDEEDLAKYLECEIDEPRDHMEYDPLDMDSSGSLADIASSADDATPVKNLNRGGEELDRTVDLGEESRDSMETEKSKNNLGLVDAKQSHTVKISAELKKAENSSICAVNDNAKSDINKGAPNEDSEGLNDMSQYEVVKSPGSDDGKITSDELKKSHGGSKIFQQKSNIYSEESDVASDEQVSKEITSSTKEPVKVQKESLGLPNEPTSSPKESIKLPKEPITSPKEPMKLQKEPTMSPNENIKTAKESLRSPNEPIKRAKEPTMLSTEPIKTVLKESTRSPNEPIKTAKEPTRSQNESIKRAKEPTMLSTEPIKTVKESTRSPNEPIKTAKSPNEPIKTAKEPRSSPNEPIKIARELTRSPNEPIKTAKDPTMSSNEPTKTAKDPTGSPMETVKSPKELFRPLKEPIKSFNEAMQLPKDIIRPKPILAHIMPIDDEYEKISDAFKMNNSKGTEESKSYPDLKGNIQKSSKMVEDEEINEELENQLLGASDEAEMEEECLDNLELEGEL